MSNPIRYGLDTGNRVGSIRTWNQTKLLPIFVRVADGIKPISIICPNTARIIPLNFYGAKMSYQSA